MKEKAVTLELFHGDERLFASEGRWLYPLLELEQYLSTSRWPEPGQRGELEVHDKIVGKAAALLLVRLGIRKVHAGLLSLLGEAVLRRHGVELSHRERVARISCRTETLLAEVEDPEEAYRLIRERIAREGS
jgi:hypothetical protein